ncbi:hypothetical protein MAPG_08764 [Magnaporthiopsis poae ATCC 64411]|uniref:Uncharacterized protein n=1 Tax=Magnaporthiopsis poae (strain ATCC 64411 / 73-15) TaxID=644358 RepID=A0A0C4E872_MAGP6|nr:hypothetical protein MAPG_08764 [Magnaporthiopsis poae ATCC 64411]
MSAMGVVVGFFLDGEPFLGVSGVLTRCCGGGTRSRKASRLCRSISRREVPKSLTWMCGRAAEYRGISIISSRSSDCR